MMKTADRLCVAVGVGLAAAILGCEARTVYVPVQAVAAPQVVQSPKREEPPLFIRSLQRIDGNTYPATGLCTVGRYADAAKDLKENMDLYIPLGASQFTGPEPASHEIAAFGRSIGATMAHVEVKASGGVTQVSILFLRDKQAAIPAGGVK